MARNNRLHKLINAAKKDVDNAPIETQFLGSLEKVIETIKEKQESKPSRAYKPSSLVCKRNMYYQMSGAELDPSKDSASFIRICESGTDGHERLQYYVTQMKEHGMDCEYIDVAKYVEQRALTNLEVIEKNGFETKLYDKDLQLRFLCDGIIRYLGRYYIFEIKTEISYNFQRRDGVDAKHIPQACAYSAALGIEDVIFLYENRDNCAHKSYLLHITDDMRYDNVIAPIQSVENHLQKGVVPARPERTPIIKKACQYCRYRSICVQDGS